MQARMQIENDSDHVFGAAVAYTRERSPASFDQWFSGVQFDGLTDGVLSLRARDEFVRDWVEDHFLPVLTDFIRAQTGWSVHVAWTIDGALDRAIADQPSLPPVRPRALTLRASSAPSSLPTSVVADTERVAFASPNGSASTFGHAAGGYGHTSGAIGTPSMASALVPLVPVEEAHEGDAVHGLHSQTPNALGPNAARVSSTSHAAPLGREPLRREPPRRESGVQAIVPVAAPIEGLNPKYTFSNFVVGPSNQLAHAASIAAAGGGGRRHNPLFICGGTGLGKTHLVHAVAYRVRAERPSARIVYISAEKFVNEFVQALQDQRMSEFRARYRERCDLLLVDDIQFLASKTQTQEEFFHAFNALHQADKQIIVTSDKYPQALERMEERLVSRFSWGLVADIQAPELETRVAILRKKAQIEHIDLADDVVLYLAQAVRSNVRELEGTLIRLAAKSSLLGRPVDLEFAKGEIAAATSIRPNEASVEDIQRVVCHYFKLRSTDLLSKDRHKSVAFARHVAMYLCKQRLKCSFPELGRAFGNRDHTTVMSAVRKIESLRAENAQVRAELEAIERKLGAID